MGCYEGWTCILNVYLNDILSQHESGWLGCWMTLSGCIGSVIVGYWMDRFQGRLKSTAFGLLAGSFLAFLTFCINIDSRYGWESTTVTYLCGILGGLMFNSSIPLFLEMIMETIFGWGNETIGSMLFTMINTLIQILFLVIPTEINGSTLWMAWLNCCSMVAGCLVLYFCKVQYKRLEFDQYTKTSSQCEKYLTGSA